MARFMTAIASDESASGKIHSPSSPQNQRSEIPAQ